MHKNVHTQLQLSGLSLIRGCTWVRAVALRYSNHSTGFASTLTGLKLYVCSKVKIEFCFAGIQFLSNTTYLAYFEPVPAKNFEQADAMWNWHHSVPDKRQCEEPSNKPLLASPKKTFPCRTCMEPRKTNQNRIRRKDQWQTKTIPADNGEPQASPCYIDLNIFPYRHRMYFLYGCCPTSNECHANIHPVDLSYLRERVL